jgi:hypothetical protein
VSPHTHQKLLLLLPARYIYTHTIDYVCVSDASSCCCADPSAAWITMLKKKWIINIYIYKNRLSIYRLTHLTLSIYIYIIDYCSRQVAQVCVCVYRLEKIATYFYFFFWKKLFYRAKKEKKNQSNDSAIIQEMYCAAVHHLRDDDGGSKIHRQTTRGFFFFPSFGVVVVVGLESNNIITTTAILGGCFLQFLMGGIEMRRRNFKKEKTIIRRRCVCVFDPRQRPRHFLPRSRV